jgi:trk system potassium uptake protein TrkH
MKKKLSTFFWVLTQTISKRVFGSPARLSVLAFLLLILSGALLLCLPVSSAGRPIGFIDALFTATSAGCVTGLSTINVASDLSAFGQGVLLCLIQVGGLGIMTLSTVLILLAGGKTSFTERHIIKDTYTHSGRRSPASILYDVLLLTFIMELCGSVILFIKFYPGYGFNTALYYAVFHSVSAFCNAGFALFPGSLEMFRGDWVVNLVIVFLIITGGLGFLVISEIRTTRPFNKRKWNRLSLHTKIVLTATFFLIFSGMLIFLYTEWNNTLASFSVSEKLLASLFQSVTYRTAGFNTIPFDRLANETLFISMIFMFIGACPGSCGGGIKTTTAASLFLLGVCRMTGKDCTSAFNRTIPDHSIAKATNVVMISMFVITVGTIFLLMTELGNISHLESRGKFIELLFEVVSAFGTAGLSMGVTDSLSASGRLIITAIMFIGRLGPMIIATAISRKTSKAFMYAQENLMIG